MSEKTVLFGPADEIVKYGKDLDWESVACIIDNNPQNHNKKINGKMIFPITVLSETEYDRIILFSTKFINQMHAQLMQAKVPEEKIICWTNFVKNEDDTEIALKAADILNKLKCRQVLDDSDFYADFVPVKCIQSYEMDSVIRIDHKYDAVLLLNEYKDRTPEDMMKSVQNAVSQYGTAVFNIPYPCPADCTAWNLIPYGKLGRCHVLPCVMSQIVTIEKGESEEAEHKRIYIVTNKKCMLPQSRLYQPIWAGKGANEEGYLDDRLGESISNLYPIIGENTAIYWLWKHSQDDIIGINLQNKYLMRNDIFIDRGNLIDSKTIDDIMQSFDMILPKPMLYPNVTLKEQLKSAVSNEAFETGWEVMVESIKKNQPDYLETFESVMAGHLFFPHNIFIMKKEIMNDYCEWLFSFLLEPAYKIDATDYDPQSRQILELFAEKMLTVWLTKNPHKVKIMNALITG